MSVPRSAPLILLASTLLAFDTAHGQTASNFVDDELLVKYHLGQVPATLVSGSLLAAGAISAQPFVTQGAVASTEPITQWLHVILAPGTDEALAIQTLEADPAVELAVQNVYGEIVALPNDPQFTQQWGLNNTGQVTPASLCAPSVAGTPGADIDAPAAWDFQTGNSSVVVAVIDTGISYTHPDLAGNMWTNPDEIPANGIDDDASGYIDDIFGADIYNGDGNPADDNGHGTHVAGTVGAVGNNGIGVTGAAWDVQLMAVKSLNFAGSHTCAHATASVVYAVLQGADIINASWRILEQGFCQSLSEAILLANNLGVLFVAAAGNFADDNDVISFEPATFPRPNILAVGATNYNDQLASFSNFGHYSVEVAAPGVSIRSTELVGNSYGTRCGTSMAAPHVAGVASVLLSHFPTASPLDLKEAIVLGADDKPGLNNRVIADGRLNAFNALGELSNALLTPGNGWSCDDEVDNDGDGFVDFAAGGGGDPACFDVFGPLTENPACQDGVDNDNDGKIDFDGGASWNGGEPIAAVDNGCSAFWDGSEATDGCGLGFEVAVVLAALLGLRRHAKASRMG